MSTAAHHSPLNCSPSPWKTALWPVSLTFIGSNTISPNSQARNQGTNLATPFLPLSSHGSPSPVYQLLLSLLLSPLVSSCICSYLDSLMQSLILSTHLLPASRVNPLSSESDGVITVRMPLTAWLPSPSPCLAAGSRTTEIFFSRATPGGVPPWEHPSAWKAHPFPHSGQTQPILSYKAKTFQKAFPETLLSSTPPPCN